MPRCPFAQWMPISGESGSNTGGPFKIVHHTTEGSSAQGAFDAFRSHHSDPHFTVDGAAIYQHIDTSKAARALKNPAGGVETNRDSAVQIEVVGFAHRPKARDTLNNVRKLCRWIETTHNVPKVWPNGPPKPAINGHDPGGHNRNAHVWDTTAGHYGHSNVPENEHWDPGYTATEIAFLMLDSNEGLEFSSMFETIIAEDPGLATDHSRMADHDNPNPEPKRKMAKQKVSAVEATEAPSAMPAITDAIIPRGRRDRPGTAITATSVTIHNTDNPDRGANAKAHARALVSGSLLGEYVRSWHFTVDDVSVYRHLPINEMAYHAGKRAGNTTSIGVEICENADLDAKAAYRNAAQLAAQLLKQIGKTPATGLKQHHDWSGKDCPGVLRHKAGGWDSFVADVTAAFSNEAVDTALQTSKAKTAFTSATVEEAAAKLENALADPVIRSIVRHEYLHAASSERNDGPDIQEAPR
jgi:N-acetylmuramoyl-L-alanine amidase CwlA